MKVQTKNEEVESQQIERIKKRSTVLRTVTVEDVHNDLRKLWQNTIATKHGFESFANFLAEQFSVENLLFITEYCQLKKAIVKDDAFRKLIDADNVDQHTLKLPDQLTLSLTTQRFNEKARDVDKEDEAEMKSIIFDAMKELYTKYIISTAPLEINISSRQRANIHAVFQNRSAFVTVAMILDVMEVAVDDVISLITGASMRYNPDSMEMKRKHFHVQSMTIDLEVDQILQQVSDTATTGRTFTPTTP